MSISFERPDVLLLIPVVVLLTLIVIRKTFVRMQSKEAQRQYVASKRKTRLLMMLSRSLLFAALLVAIANPFTIDSAEVRDDPRLSLFVDSSESMQLFESGVAERVKDAVSGSVPVTMRTIASGNRSNLGDAIINFAQGDDSVLLVSDGHAHYGRSLEDVLLFSRKLNTTVSALAIRPVHADAVVRIEGPSRTTVGVPTDFFVVVEEAGSMDGYALVVEVDGTKMVDERVSGPDTFRFTVSLSEGYHRMIARISVRDYVSDNNVFYKVVNVEPKPRVLLVSPDGSPMSTVFGQLYDLTVADTLPADVSTFSTVVLENVPQQAIPVSRLVDYVTDGNGLVVVGGGNAYDLGGYRGSVFESLLPVVVGSGTQTPAKDVNVAVVIDISGTSTQQAAPGSELTKAELSKALVDSLLNDLKPTDNVAVIAFHTKAILVSPLTQLSQNKVVLQERVARIYAQSGPGTLISEGIRAARELLAPLEGSKSIVLLSDGLPGGPASEDVRAARVAANQGTKVYAIQVGEDAFGASHLQEIAAAGNGVYFAADDQHKLRILFGDADSEELESYRMEVINGYHFITRSVILDGAVTGFNQVVPKDNAELLVATSSGNPLVTAWRFGLGRVVSVSTDDGSAWAGQMLSRRNSQLLSKSVNWAVGDLGRNKQFDVRMQDAFLGDAIDVGVISSAAPAHDALSFQKVGENRYLASFTPEHTGFHEVFNAVVAVNSPREFSKVGLNPRLADLVRMSNGRVFQPEETDALVEKVLQDALRVETTQISYAWLPLLAALMLLLAEIAARKFAEKRNVNK